MNGVIDVLGDLHEAETLVGRYTRAVRATLQTTDDGLGAIPPVQRARLVELVSEALRYCRPSCGMNGKVHRLADGEIDELSACGCMCHEVPA